MTIDEFRDVCQAADDQRRSVTALTLTPASAQEMTESVLGDCAQPGRLPKTQFKDVAGLAVTKLVNPCVGLIVPITVDESPEAKDVISYVDWPVPVKPSLWQRLRWAFQDWLA